MSLLGWKRLDTGMLLPISGAEVMYATASFPKNRAEAGIQFFKVIPLFDSNGLSSLDIPLVTFNLRTFYIWLCRLRGMLPLAGSILVVIGYIRLK